MKKNMLIIVALAVINAYSNISAQPAARIPQWGKKDVEFLGCDYARIGYALSNAEEMELLFRNNTALEKKFPVSWVLKTYQGQALSNGAGMLELAAGSEGKITIELPGNLQDGPYNIIFTPETEGWTGSHSYYFDYRIAKQNDMLNLEIVSFIEGMDPEGWVRMMLGPLEGFCNVRNEFPKKLSEADAAIVIAEALDYYNPRFDLLQDYVRQGGTILVFGKTAPVLSLMLPVEGSSAISEKGKPLALKPLEGGPWTGFNPGQELCHYPVRVTAKQGATILAEWSDGSPAVVSGTFGLGKVIYIGTGSYQVWQERKSMKGADELALRLLYDDKGGAEAVSLMLKQAESSYAENEDEKAEARSRTMAGMKVSIPDDYFVVNKDNAGRFGWLIEEGGLTEVLYQTGIVEAAGSLDLTQRNSPAISFSIALNGDSKPAYSGVKQNWLAKTIEWTYSSGEKLSSTMSVGSPFILWEGSSRTVSIANSPATHVAYQSKGGIKLIAKGEKINPVEMTENWILTFIADSRVRDMPQLIVLTKRPESIIFDGDLRFGFRDPGFANMLTSRLYGIRRLAPGESISWLKGIPADVINDAKRWSQIALSYPVDCDEVGWIEGGIVKIADKFRFRELSTDWKTKPITMSPVPPVCLLAKKAGAPLQIPEGLSDLKCYTKFGPLMAAKGAATVVCGIPLPPLDHRAIVPAEGRMVLSEMINRNVQGLALNSLAYADPNIRDEGAGDWHEDLLPYDYSRLVPYNQSPQIDLYKWWYVFDVILARTVYTDSIRKEIDRHYNTRYWEVMNFYPHKSLVMQKREPWTGLKYMITFIWPTQTTPGFRHFHDANEAAGINIYCYTNYARYYGDWSTLKSNWNLCRELYNFLPKNQDWAGMSSGCMEYWLTSGLDMLNSESFGCLTYAYAAANAGYPEEATEARVLGARNLIPTVARLAMPAYISSLTKEGDPWRDYVSYQYFRETKVEGSASHRGSVAWLSTSKGGMHELALGYKLWTPDAMNREQRAIGATASSVDLTQRLFLGWDRDSLLASVTRQGERTGRAPQRGGDPGGMPAEWAAAQNLGAPPRVSAKLEPGGFGIDQKETIMSWQSAMGAYDYALLCIGDIPVFLSDWAPAEYISGNYNVEKRVMNIALKSYLGEPFTVRIYSQYQPFEVKVNGDILQDSWSYDPKTGWLKIDLKGEDVKNIVVTFGRAVAPLHPYFSGIAE